MEEPGEGKGVKESGEGGGEDEPGGWEGEGDSGELEDGIVVGRKDEGSIENEPALDKGDVDGRVRLEEGSDAGEMREVKASGGVDVGITVLFVEGFRREEEDGGVREGVECFGREEGNREVREEKIVFDSVGVGMIVLLVEDCGREEADGVELGRFNKDDGLSSEEMPGEMEVTELGLIKEDDATDDDVDDNALGLDGETVGLETGD